MVFLMRAVMRCFPSFLYFQGEIQYYQHHDSDYHCRPSESVERNTEQAHGEHEREVAPQAVVAVETLVDSPHHGGNEQHDVYYHSCVETEAEGVDEEELEPSAHLDDAWHYSIEYRCNDDERDEERHERALAVGIREFAIVIYEHDCRHTEQVEQVDTDAQSRHIHDEHEPAVAMGSSAWSSHFSMSQNTTAVKADE